ncbi:MAG: hypothetical protein ACXWG1_00830 [Usitatibacter sp.]
MRILAIAFSLLVSVMALAGTLYVLLMGGCATAPEGAGLARPLQPAIGALLRGDAREGLRRLDAVEVPLTPKQKTAADCIRERFSHAAPVEGLPPAASEILAAYQDYWRAAMLDPGKAAAAEAALLKTLNAIPTLAGASDHASIDSVTDYVADALTAEGLHAITGKTQPLYELMIWKVEETRVYDIALPERGVAVKVVFLDDFASPGWSGWATCGVAQTGGWAKPDALYAVRSSYDVGSEEFRVSYLAHEGQHFADYEDYPLLEQPELEYRAKLTEIAMSSGTTSKLLAGFASMGGTSRDAPHAFANRQVTLALGGAPRDRVREVAAGKLRESSATLKRLGAATTKRFLRGE